MRRAFRTDYRRTDYRRTDYRRIQYRRIGFVVGLFGAEVGAVVMLERLGRVGGFSLPRHDVGHWLLRASTEDLFAVAARMLGLALAWWLLGATVLSIARRAVPGWRGVHALDSLTPATVRHLLDRALALGLGASFGLASIHPAGAATPVPAANAVAGIDRPVVRAPAASTAMPRQPVDTPVVRSVPREVLPRAASRAPVAPLAPTSPTREAVVIVQAGDNLWVIARRALRAAQPTGSTEIAPYWRRVVAANFPRLRSHDPDLIYPGERIALPPVAAPPKPGSTAPHG